MKRDFLELIDVHMQVARSWPAVYCILRANIRCVKALSISKTAKMDHIVFIPLCKTLQLVSMCMPTLQLIEVMCMAMLQASQRRDLPNRVPSDFTSR